MTQERKLKVTVSLSKGLEPKWVTPKGLQFNDKFIDRLHEKDEFFRERIILQINEFAGNDWSVHFTEYPNEEPTYFVDITAEEIFLRPIIQIISDSFPELKLVFWKPNPWVCLGTRRRIVVE
jgi:hypothetical protein